METIDFGVDIDACRKNFEAREAQRRLEGERLRQTARQAFWAAIETALPHYPDVKRVYLFGSVTREGAFQRGSDIDVAVVVTIYLRAIGNANAMASGIVSGKRTPHVDGMITAIACTANIKLETKTIAIRAICQV